MGQGGREFTFPSYFSLYAVSDFFPFFCGVLEDRIFEARGLAGLARLLGLLEGG